MPVGNINYSVPNMQLVVQDQNMACWYASAMMLIQWREWNTPGSRCYALDSDTINLYKANNGIQNPQIIPLAKRLGFVSVPPMSPTIDALHSWLKSYGPLWTNGKRHIVVIAGVRGSDRTGYEVLVYDPWPDTGIGWRTLSGWYTGFDGKNSASSRDAGADVEAVFLHLPATNALSKYF